MSDAGIVAAIDRLTAAVYWNAYTTISAGEGRYDLKLCSDAKERALIAARKAYSPETPIS